MDEVKKLRKIFTVIIILIVIIATVIAIVSSNIISKIQKIQFNGELDKSQLAINEELYNEVADIVTQEEFNSIKNIALFGICEERCDLITIASINQLCNKIKLIVIPTDTYVNIEEYGEMEINQAYEYGKEQLMLKTINSNYGLNISKYITVDFNGFKKLINQIGGIKLNITGEEKRYINENIYATLGENATMLTEAENVTLTGNQAIAFIKNGDNIKNTEIANRQKRVFVAILDKLHEKSIKQIWKSIDYILEEVKMNLNKEQDMGIGRDIINDANLYLQKTKLIQISFSSDTEVAKQEIKNAIYGDE